MLWWPWKKKPIPSDVDEARRLRVEASEEYRQAVVTGLTVAQITSYLHERRALNHFGESIQITFTRRGSARADS